MTQINPYEPPQTESLVEQADELSLAEHVGRSFDMLFRVQIVFFVAFAICFLIMTEPMNWLGKLYRSALWGSTLTSLLIAMLAAFYRQWGLVLLEILLMIGSILLLNH